MGHVQIDVLKSERQFDLISFSDFDCVKGLIRHRSMVDRYRGIEIDRNFNNAGDIHPMNPTLIAIFVTLDDLLAKCNLNIKQKFIIDKIMDGYTEQDVADMFKQDVSGITKTLNRICKRIVDINNREWKYDYVYMNKAKTPYDYKACSKCGEMKPVTGDFFHIDVLSKDGFKNKCKTCMNGGQ